VSILAAVERRKGRRSHFSSRCRVTDRIHARQPYATHKGQRLLNARDWIFREGGTQLVLPVAEVGEGFAATYRIAVQPGIARRAT
jgi:hypothetical protein